MKIQQLIPAKYVLNTPVTALRFDEQIFLILKWARAHESRIVCVANVHMLMEAHWNREFAAVLNAADLVAPDGMPLVWMLRQLGTYGQDRVAGMDVFLRLCQLSPQCKVSIFFVGSQQEILERMRKRLEQEFPNIQIAGMEPLPFRPLTAAEDRDLIEKINDSGAGLVFVCLGCPKQEYWMMQHQHKIKAVAIGIGAVFAVYAGIQKRAPVFIRNSGLEWLYRLAQEPTRLWGRYRQTIPPFMWLALQQVLAQSRFESPTNLFKGFIPTEEDNEFDLLLVNSNPAKLGEILLRQNVVSEDALLTALEKQRQTARKIGEILVEQRYISEAELEYYLKNQKVKLGELLVDRNILSRDRLDKLLARQKITNKKLGELIAQQKILSRQQIDDLLLEQYLRHKGLWLMTDEIEDSFSLKPSLQDKYPVATKAENRL